MIRVDLQAWQQTVGDLHHFALHSDHPRTRERFSALHMMVSRGISATEVAREIGRQDETVIGWVNRYNALGPSALEYHRTGGRRPFWNTPNKLLKQ